MNRRSNDVTAQSAAILSWLRQRDSEMAALLADLVAITTENPPGKNYRARVDFLESHLRQVVLTVIAWDRALRETTPRILLRVCSRPTAVENAPSEMCPGLLVIRFYAALGMPTFAYGPGLLSVAHRPNEYVDLRRIGETIYLALLWVLT